MDKSLSTFEGWNLPALTNKTDCAYTVYFKPKDRCVWMHGATFESLERSIKEQRDLEKYGDVEKSVIIKTEVTTKQTYLWGC